MCPESGCSARSHILCRARCDRSSSPTGGSRAEPATGSGDGDHRCLRAREVAQPVRGGGAPAGGDDDCRQRRYLGRQPGFFPGWIEARGRGPPRAPALHIPRPAPANENGGLLRILDVASRRVIRTIRPDKRPRREFEILSLAYAPDGRTILAHRKEVWPKEGGGHEVGYHVAVWDAATGRTLRRIDSAKLDDWELLTFSRDVSAFAARTLRVSACGTSRPAANAPPR